jgi:hypothetical protein
VVVNDTAVSQCERIYYMLIAGSLCMILRLIIQTFRIAGTLMTEYRTRSSLQQLDKKALATCHRGMYIDSVCSIKLDDQYSYDLSIYYMVFRFRLYRTYILSEQSARQIRVRVRSRLSWDT